MKQLLAAFLLSKFFVSLGLPCGVGGGGLCSYVPLKISPLFPFPPHKISPCSFVVCSPSLHVSLFPTVCLFRLCSRSIPITKYTLFSSVVNTAEDYVIMYPLFSGDRAKNDQLRVLSKFKVSRHQIVIQSDACI